MVKGTRAVFVAWLASGCAKPLDVGVVLTPSTLSTADPTVCELLARAREPRRFGGAPWPSPGPGESASSRAWSSRVSIGAGPNVTAARACVARLERDSRPMLAGASASPTGGAARVTTSERRAAQPASLCSEALRLARLPLESLRRDPLALGPSCRF